MRIVARFLRASWDRSIESAGRVDLIVGAVMYLAGRAVNVDLGLATVTVVLGWFAIRVLVLTPARMWHEAQQSTGDEPAVTVSEGGTYINAPGASITLGPATRVRTAPKPVAGQDSVWGNIDQNTSSQ